MSAVLELAGGAAERLGIKAGDRVRYPLFKAGTALITSPAPRVGYAAFTRRMPSRRTRERRFVGA